MPITASLGALAYSRGGAEQQLSEYWAIKNIGENNLVSSLFAIDGINQAIYMLGYGITSLKVSGLSNPTFSYYNLLYPSQFYSGDAEPYVFKKNTYTNNYEFFGYANVEYRPAFNFYDVYAGYTGVLDTTVGDFSSSRRSYPNYGAPPADNKLKKVYTDFTVDSSGNYFVVGYDTEYFGTTNYKGYPNIWKFDNTYTTLSNTRLAETFSNYNTAGFYYLACVCLDSSENPIMSYTFQQNSSINTNRIILRKLTNSTSGSPNPKLSTIWSVGLAPTSNELLNCVSLVTDSTGNIYGCYQSETSTKSYVIKYDSSGTVIWQKSVSAKLGSLILKSDTEIYVSGYTAGTSAYLYIAKLDDAGSVSFERRVGPNTFSAQTLKNQIAVYDNNMYVTGNYSDSTNQRPYLIKLPDDGTIPAPSFRFSDGTTGTYATYSASWTTSALTSWTPGSETALTISQTLDSIGDTNDPQTNIRSIAFIA
jgi:hypothetical protein